MKTITRIISLLMVALMLTTSVPFMPVRALDDGTEEYTLTIENTYSDSSLAENSSVGGISFFGSTEFDGCYGNQLSDVAREIYDSLVKKYVTDKTTGEYAYTFEAPFTFDAEISGNSIVTNDELESVELEIQYAVQAAMDAFLYDNPEVFWLKKLSTSYGVSASGNSVDGFTGSIEDITIIPEEIYAGASSKFSQYDIAVDSALDSITVTESRYDTLKNIHDYICNNAWYNLVNEQRVHSSEPFFIGDGGVVCEGYAKAFKVLCDRMAIPCVLVSGDAGGAHMWNYVQMDDGKWYLIDATWDDQESKIYDTYFLANANTIGFDDVAISEERTERSDFSGTGIFSFTYPVLSDTTYTVHIHEWDSDYTVDVEPTCTEKGSKSIHCKTCDETKSVTEIAATNHANKTEHAQQNATCTENGYTAGVYCSDCEKWLEGHYIITNEGHIDENTDGFCDICEECISEIVETGKCGDNVYYIFYEDGTLIISGNGNMYNYSLYYHSSPFLFNTDIKSVVIEEGVTGIGAAVFAGCSLSNVTIPKTVTKIGNSAFYGCINLVSITIPDSVVSIGEESFCFCEGLIKVIIENGVKTIADGAFSGCSITDIIIPDSVTTIGSESFYGCYNLKNLTIGNGVTNIGSDAFNSCRSLTDVSIPDSVITLGDRAFCSCKSLVNIEIPDSVTDIGVYAFAYCESLTNITIPNNIKVLCDGVFQYCTKLKNITFSKNLEAINSLVFYQCKSLTNVTIPSDVTVIGQYAFSECDSLTSIMIPDGVTGIYRYSFSECDNLSSVILNESIIEIGFGAFDSCVKLKEILYGGTAEQWKNVSVDFENAEFSSADVYFNHYCPHTYSSVYVIDKKTTCTASGSKSKHCTRNGCTAKTDVTVIPKLAHTEIKVSAVPSTCTKTGLTEGKKCADCGKVTLAQKIVAKKAHTYKTTVTKATLSKNGKTETKCTVCGYISKTTVIYAPKTVKLSAVSYAYNGKAKTPSVTVKDYKGNTLKKDTDYTVSYESGRTYPGEYTVKITFKGKYEGTKKLYFTIAPKATSKITATQTTTTITLKWSKVTGADGYRVYKYNSKTKKYEKLKDVTGTSLKISKLSAGTAYKYKVRAYTKDDGTIWGAYSSVFETATKPATPKITKLSTTKGKASFTWSNVSGESGYQVYYSTKKDSGYKKVASYKTNVVKGSKSKLTSGKTYYFKVRAYKKTASGTVYSAWSPIKSLKVK